MIVCFGEVLMDCLPDRKVIGGAPFNVAVNLKRMGNDVTFVSKIGTDDFGDIIYDFAANENIGNKIQKDPNEKTGYVSVSFDKGEPKYTIHNDVAWEKINYSPLKSIDYIVFGSLATIESHNKKTLESYINTNPKAIKICDLNLRKPFYNDVHIKYCIDQCDILKVNESEWSHILQLYQLPEQEFLKNFNTKARTMGVILTKGEKGAAFKTATDTIVVAPQHISKRAFKDAIGAGDGFLAAFINQWIKTNNIKTALESGIAHASEICKTQGAILPKTL